MHLDDTYTFLSLLKLNISFPSSLSAANWTLFSTWKIEATKRELRVPTITIIPCPAACIFILCLSAYYQRWPIHQKQNPPLCTQCHPSHLQQFSLTPNRHVYWSISISTQTYWYFSHMQKQQSLVMATLPLADFTPCVCSPLEQTSQRNHLCLLCPVLLRFSQPSPKSGLYAPRATKIVLVKVTVTYMLLNLMVNSQYSSYWLIASDVIDHILLLETLSLLGF